MRCEDVTSLLLEDGWTPGPEVTAHLNACAQCRALAAAPSWAPGSAGKQTVTAGSQGTWPASALPASAETAVGKPAARLVATAVRIGIPSR